MTNGPLLEARGVVVRRAGEGGRLQTVLHATSVHAGAGEVLAVVGPSGSGKSTLLRLFNRLLEPDSGQVTLAGQDVRRLDPPGLRAMVTLVTQKPFLFQGTVRENLGASARFRRAASPDPEQAEMQDILSLCQVSPAWLGKDARKLSVGQQQRVCLARALLGPCRALLLDEPTSALDRPTADQLAQTFRQLAERRGLAIVLVTHDLSLAARCADRVALLLDGSIVEEGPAGRVLNSPESAAAKAFLSSTPAQGKEAE